MLHFIDYTYHSHTKRCGHARGEDGDYASTAYSEGYKILGYSDHVMLPGITQNGMRGDFSLLDGYIDSVHSLQKEYEGKLTIYLAFECEWYYSRFSQYYQSLLKERGFDYLILGQHCFLTETNTPIFYGQMKDEHLALEMYTNDIIAGIHSRLFLYVCHPDLFREWYPTWDDFAIKCAKRIIEAAKEEDIPLEVNLGCIRWESADKGSLEEEPTYPYGPFWDLVSASGNRVICGVDSHCPDHLVHSPWEWVEEFIKNHHLNYVNRLEIKHSIK
jgi:histidinol-phosphatase (PHP family)